MPRFFFDLRTEDAFRRDDFGDVFETLAEARAQAATLLPDFGLYNSWGGDAQVYVCEVRDEAGRVVCRVEMEFRGTAAAEDG